MPKGNRSRNFTNGLLERCQQYGSHRIAGREDDRTVEERFESERSRLLPLPGRPYENYKPLRVKVDRYQTVRVDRNRYSVERVFSKTRSSWRSSRASTSVLTKLEALWNKTR